MTDFARLSRNWIYWSGVAQLGDLTVSETCDDCAILFGSNDYSVHLRSDGLWWSVDTINDRRHRQNDTARFSRYALAEKYFVWIWGTTARSVVGAPVLGPRLYGFGFAKDVTAAPISEGIFELRSEEGRAELMEPYATIFSHLMDRPEEEIERMVLADMGRDAPI